MSPTYTRISYTFLLSSLTYSQILAKSSFEWSPTYLPHNLFILIKKKEKRGKKNPRWLGYMTPFSGNNYFAKAK
jgi:hypothetical protein